MEFMVLVRCRGSQSVLGRKVRTLLNHLLLCTSSTELTGHSQFQYKGSASVGGLKDENSLKVCCCNLCGDV